MSIVIFGHDVTYALLCRAIADALPSDEQPIFYCNRPGLYWFARNQLRLQTVRAGRNRLALKLVNGQRPPFDVDLKFFAASKMNSRYWSALAKWHYDQAVAVLKPLEPKLIISPGEYRITEQAFQAAARYLHPNTPLIYFEAGPGPYVYLDPKGVNANASFAQSSKSNVQRRSKTDGVILAQHRNYRQLKSSLAARLATIADFLWIFAIQLISPINEFSEYIAAIKNRWQIIRTKFNKKSIHSKDLPNNYVLFIDQVKSDVNATHFSVCKTQIIEQIETLMKLQPETHIIWRSHPLELRDDLFNLVKNLAPDRVERSGNKSLDNEIKGASAILTVNSNGGLDSLLSGKPVLLFGKSYYQNLYGVVNSADLLDIFLKSDSYNSKKIADEARTFIEECFLPVDYRGCDFKNVNILADQILYYSQGNK